MRWGAFLHGSRFRIFRSLASGFWPLAKNQNIMRIRPVATDKELATWHEDRRSRNQWPEASSQRQNYCCHLKPEHWNLLALNPACRGVLWGRSSKSEVPSFPERRRESRTLNWTFEPWTLNPEPWNYENEIWKIRTQWSLPLRQRVEVQEMLPEQQHDAQ